MVIRLIEVGREDIYPTNVGSTVPWAGVLDQIQLGKRIE